MKNCINCGAPMNDADIICQNCGARNVPVQAPKKTGIQLPDFNKIPKKYLGIAAIVAALVILLVVTIIFSESSSYKSAIDNFMDVAMHGKTEKLESLAPEEYWDNFEDERDMDIDDVIELFEDQDYSEHIKKGFEDEVGENYKISYKVTKEKEVSEKKLKKLKEVYNDDFSITRKTIKKAVIVDLEITVKGEDDTFVGTYDELWLINIDGKWYPGDDNTLGPMLVNYSAGIELLD